MMMTPRSLALLVAVTIAAISFAEAYPEVPQSWPLFNLVASIDPNAKNTFVNSPLHAVQKIASYLNIGALNSPAAKDVGERRCDVAFAIKTNLFDEVNGTVIIVTNQSGLVPDALWDRGGTGNAFEHVATDAFGLWLSNDKLSRGIFFDATLVCALMPEHSSFSTANSVQLPIVFPSVDTIDLLVDTMAQFSAWANHTNATLLLELFNLNRLEFNASFKPLNWSNVVPWTMLTAIATRSITDGGDFLAIAPLHSIDMFSSFWFGSQRDVNSIANKLSQGRTCDLAIGVVRTANSNTIAIVTDPQMNVRSELFSTAKDIFLEAVSGDLALTIDPLKQDGVRFHFALVCADFASFYPDPDNVRYSSPDDFFPPLVASDVIDDLLDSKYIEPIVAATANGVLSNAELEARFNMTALTSAVFFPQWSEVAPRTASPPDTRSSPDHLTAGGIVGITIACVVAFFLFVYVLHQRQVVKTDAEGTYEQVMDTTRRV